MCLLWFVSSLVAFSASMITRKVADEFFNKVFREMGLGYSVR